MLTQSDIIRKTRGFAKEIFKTEFNLPITFSGRMTHALGYFRYSPKLKKPVRIQFSARLDGDTYSESTVDSVILHELTHWYMFINNKPFSDGDKEFKMQALKVGASLTGTIPNVGSGYKVTCSHCKELIGVYNEKKVAKIKNGSYISSCCNAEIIVDNTITKVEDKFERPRAQEQWIEDTIAKYSVSNKQVVNIKVNKPSEIKDVVNVANVEKTASGKNKYPGMTFEQITQLKRVSNAQMIPAIKFAIDNNNINDIIRLKEKYTVIYNGSLKYLGKAYTTKLNTLVG